MSTKVIDITDWNEQPWFNTGGTRSKKYVQSPDGRFYYFKRSFKTDNRDYFFEFWSEVIASQLGTMLGFNVLQYDVAYIGEDVGCICESMVNDDNELIEGGKLMLEVENDFDPNVRELRKLYSFQLIDITLQQLDLVTYINDIIGIILFDALIGNSDRHQENWACTFKWSLEFGLAWIPQFNFAPIYDSGSSLGRELTEEKVASMLRNPPELDAYIDRGKSEIHWENQKVNHFELISALLLSPYAETTAKVIEQVLEKFDGNRLQAIMAEIDSNIPDELLRYKLPEPRKRLIIKMVTLRYERLKALYDERV